MNDMSYGQGWLIPHNHYPRQATEGNSIAGLNQHDSILRQVHWYDEAQVQIVQIQTAFCSTLSMELSPVDWNVISPTRTCEHMLYEQQISIRMLWILNYSWPGMYTTQIIVPLGIVWCTNQLHNCCSASKSIVYIPPPIALDCLAVHFNMLGGSNARPIQTWAIDEIRYVLR